MDFKKKQFYNLLTSQKKGEMILNSNFDEDFYQVFNGMIKFIKPVEVSISSGKKKYDLISFNDGINFVFSEKVFNTLRKYNFTGWEYYLVNIEGIVDTNYYGFQVTGESEKLDVKEKGFQKGYSFDFSSFKNFDFFSPKGTKLVFVSKKVKEVFEKEKFSNISFEAIEDVEYYSLGR